jgi:hypothetical protein
MKHILTFLQYSNVPSNPTSGAQSAEHHPKDKTEYILRARVGTSARVEPVIHECVPSMFVDERRLSSF